MKQLIQSLANGEIKLVEVPSPNILNNEILVESIISLISSGTERMLNEFGKSSLLNKALKQPDRVKDVINKAKTDGLYETFNAVQNKINSPIKLGYSNVGIVIDKGNLVEDFEIGDLVICNGSHAELNSVSSNLCAKVPETVSEEDAVFTVLASIALQGIRLAKPSLGESFLVSGLGLIGLLTCQILKINGCKVFGIDPDPSKCNLAKKFGIKASTQIDNVTSWANKNNSGNLCDGVLISASTKSNEPIELASKITRKKGRIILIGDVGLNLSRDLFYKKELSFQVSCSYGSGRYEYGYENLSQDYPLGYVRWTAKRNFETIIELIKNKKLNLKELVTKSFDFYDSKNAYEFLLENKSALGILLKYKKSKNNQSNKLKTIKIKEEINYKETNSYKNEKPIVNLIGAGNYASRILIPNLKKNKIILNQIIANNGLAPKLLGEKYGFVSASTDVKKSLAKKNYNTLIICTRHESHASLIIKGLENKKNIFVEKPLCLTTKELIEIKEKKLPDKVLMVGFNRRFSRLTQILRKELNKINDTKFFVYTCNAGNIDKDHWTQNAKIGGGRLIGEACHFVDLLKYLSMSNIENLTLLKGSKDTFFTDNFSLHLQFKNNSTGIINYISKGNSGYPKENLQVFSENKIFELENFRKLKAWGVPKFKNIRFLKQDKGHSKCLSEFITSVTNSKNPPIGFNDIYEVHYWLLRVLEK